MAVRNRRLPGATCGYLARYANRVAISNGRLIAIEDDEVLFRYKDYRDGDQWKTKRMPGVEFIGRFLHHVLPLGLRHIRRFGFLGPRVRTEKLKQIRKLLGLSAGEPVPARVPETDSWSGDSRSPRSPHRCIATCCSGNKVTRTKTTWPRSCSVPRP